MFQSPPTRAKMIHFWVTAENLPSPVWSAGNIPHMRIKSNCPVWVGIFGPYQSAVHLLFQQKGENRPRSAMSATKNMASFLRLAWHGLGWVFKRRKQQGQTTLVGNKTHSLYCVGHLVNTCEYFILIRTFQLNQLQQGFPPPRVACSHVVGSRWHWSYYRSVPPIRHIKDHNMPCL